MGNFKSRLIRATVAIALLAWVLPSASFAQQVFGSIIGTVSDPSGAAVPNAKVTITDQSKGTQFEVQTNESGNYSKGQLIPGAYSVTVEVAGFSKQDFKDINVLVDQAAKVDAALTVGNVGETVEVTAAAPTLQSDRADVQTTFTSQQLIALPSLGRNAQAYELLTPGVQRIGFAHASSENPQGSVQASVNGQHFSGTGFQLDGTENQDPILGIVVINPNLDSLSENKIAAQDYDAEFGYAGAGIQNSSTKSGTNSFHGSAFEYFRNNSAGFQDFGRDPFSEPNGAPILRWNQFGGSIGGKIIKDKLFFFGDTELVRQRFAGSTSTFVPTKLARMGNFSEYPTTIYNPNTGNPDGSGRVAYTNNTIPVAQQSAQALAVLNYFPLPNLASNDPLNTPNYAASGGGSFDANKWDTRIDYFGDEKNSLYGRYSYQQFQRGAVGAFGSLAGGPAFNAVNFAGNSRVYNQSVAMGYTHTFSPTLIDDLRFGYVRYHVQTTPNGYGTSLAADAGIPGLNLDKTFTSGLPYFNFQNSGNTITSLGYALGANQCNCPLTELESQYQVTDNLTKVAGNHTFKFGADIRYAQNLRVPSDSHRAGELTFSPNNTGILEPGGSAPTGGLTFATFLLGNVTQFQRYVSTSTDAQENQKRWFFYGQDSWRITPKLTVNYGLRWELVFPEGVNGAGNGAELDLRTGQVDVFGVGASQGEHGYQQSNYLNLAPRLGVAYQLNPKTVIRAGYGWAYELGTFGATFGHNVTQNPPVLANQQLNSATSAGSVFNLSVGPPAYVPITVNPTTGQYTLPDGINAKARPLDMRLPRVEAYNLTVERQISNGTSLSVGYVGNVGRHVGRGSGDGFNNNVNQPAFVPGVSDTNSLRPFYNKLDVNGQPLHWTQGIDLYCMCATDTYNSLQVQLKRAYVNGYAVQLSYTWQDAVSDAADDYTFLYNRPLGRGRENFISDHTLTIAQNYDIPFGRGRKYGANLNRFLDYVAGGWNASGVTTFYSGEPFSPTINTGASGALASIANAARPNQGPGSRPNKGTGSPYASNQNRDHWLNVDPNGGLSSAFLLPADNTFGNYGYNTLRGPIFINQDLSVAKSFHITERFKTELRGEAYNLFNHANLGLPQGNSNTVNINGPNASSITSLAYGYQMRRLQFALRLDF